MFNQVCQELQATPSTWLVTGAAGFIGSHLIETLLHLNQQVVGMDNFATGHQRNIDEALANLSPAQRKNWRFITGDIRNMSDCHKAVAGVDYVLHQAALGSVPRSIEDPFTTHDVNVSGFLNMLNAAKEAKVTRVVYASSSAVYGDCAAVAKVEATTGSLLSPYAVSKMSDELYAQSFASCYDLQSVGLRYFNVFGPRQDPNGPYAAVIPLWIKSLLQDEPIFINGDGKNSRDFCYVGNVVQANILAAINGNKQKAAEVYNVAVGQPTSLNQLVAEISQLLHKETKPLYRAFRVGDIRHSLADTTLINKALGYRPLFTLNQGMQHTLAWYGQKLATDKLSLEQNYV